MNDTDLPEPEPPLMPTAPPGATRWGCGDGTRQLSAMQNDGGAPKPDCSIEAVCCHCNALELRRLD